jgi:outer membrane protein assembly factor BamB
MRIWWLGLLLPLVLVSGCAGRNKETVEPPAELQPFEATLTVDKAWSTKIGKGSERLRLGLLPATDGARVYAGSYDGRAAALEAETGRTAWSVDTGLSFSAGPGYGDDLIVFGTSNGEVLALDAATGEERWRQDVGSEMLAPPAVGQGMVVVRTVDGRLLGLGAEDGAVSWTVEQSVPALTLRGNASPQMAGNVVVSGFDNGRLGAYDSSTGEAIWEVAVATPSGQTELDRLVDISAAGLQVVGQDVYAVGYHGSAVGVDLETGLLIWQYEVSSYAGLSADWNDVYVTDDVGTVIALTRNRGTPAWRQEALRLRDVTAATRYKDALVVGDFEGYLHWLDPADGHFVARAKAASTRISGAPLVVGQYVVVQADDSTVAAFTVPDQSQ